jgi:hypothetical protein
VLRGRGGAAEKLEAFECGLTVTRRELVEHVFDQGWFEDGVRRSYADDGVGKTELHFSAIDRVEDAREESLMHQSADGDRHRRGGHAHVIGEVAEHHRLVSVEMIEDADLMGADVRAGVGVANMASVAREVDARVVAKHGGDVGAQAHARQ